MNPTIEPVVTTAVGSRIETRSVGGTPTQVTVVTVVTITEFVTVN